MCIKNVRKYKRLILLIVAAMVLGLLISDVVLWGMHARATRYVTDEKGIQHLISRVALTLTGMRPDALTVKVGEYVQFDVADSRSHEIGLGGGDEYHQAHEHAAAGEFESGTFNGDEAYRLQFKKAGVYDFHDHLHPDLFVTVIVY